MSPLALLERLEADAMHWAPRGKRWRALPGRCLQRSMVHTRVEECSHAFPQSLSEVLFNVLVAQLTEETVSLLNS